MPKVPKQDRRIEYAILGILNNESPAGLSGYDMKKEFEHNIGIFWTASLGQIYPVLKKLEECGFISKTVEQSDQRPVNRNIYTITENGKKKLVQWLKTSPGHHEKLTTLDISIENQKRPSDKQVQLHTGNLLKLYSFFLLKLYFGKENKPGGNIQHVKDVAEYLGKVNQTLELYEKMLENIVEDEVHLYKLLTVQFGKSMIKAYQEWSSVAIKMLDDLKERKYTN